LQRDLPLPGHARHAAPLARHVGRPGAARDRLRRAHLPGDGRAGGGRRPPRRRRAAARTGRGPLRGRLVRVPAGPHRARRDRPRARRRPTRADPRRRDRLGRRDDRGADPRRPARGDAQPDDDHHRPPPVDDRARGRDRGSRRRPHRRARNPRRAARDERGVPRDLRARPARAAVRGRRRGACRPGGGGVRVHQPGGSLLRDRSARVEDWSWRRTRRRYGVLVGLTAPYRTRAGFSVFSLLAATATALAPPYLAKVALDDAVSGEAGARLTLVVLLFLVAGLANWGMTYVETYMTGWVGERILADLRMRLFGHLQRLSL